MFFFERSLICSPLLIIQFASIFSYVNQQCKVAVHWVCSSHIVQDEQGVERESPVPSQVTCAGQVFQHGTHKCFTTPRFSYIIPRCWWYQDIIGTCGHSGVLCMIRLGWFSFGVSKMTNLKMSELEFAKCLMIGIGYHCCNPPPIIIQYICVSTAPLLGRTWTKSWRWDLTTERQQGTVLHRVGMDSARKN